jgi:hypothetical protein
MKTNLATGKNLLIISVLALSLISGCGEKEPEDKVLADGLKNTIGDWLHDLDAADRFFWYVGKDLTPAQITEEIEEAQHMADQARRFYAREFKEVRKCFRNGELNTANTDHACLDAAGYKRSH